MTTRITYLDAQRREQPLVRSPWHWSTEAGHFKTLLAIAQSSGDAVGAFLAKRAAVEIRLTNAEQAEAAQRGTAWLEKLLANRAAVAAEALARETLATLAAYEGGGGYCLHNLEQSFPQRIRALAKVEAWNAASVQSDRWLTEVFQKLTGADRTRFLAELRDGQHAATARALLRVGETAPELLPGFDPDALPAVAEAVARREAPAEMAELDELRHAAAVSRAAWSEAVRLVREAVPIGDKELRPIFGDDALARLAQPVPETDAHWVESLKPVRRTDAA